MDSASPAANTFSDEPVLPDSNWTSDQARKLREVLLLVMAGAAGLVLSLALFGYIGFRYYLANESANNTSAGDSFSIGDGQRGEDNPASSSPPAIAEDEKPSIDELAGSDPPHGKDTLTTDPGSTSNHPQETATRGDPDNSVATDVTTGTELPAIERERPGDDPADDPPSGAPDGPPDLNPGETVAESSDPSDSLLDDLKDFGKYFDDKPFDAAEVVGSASDEVSKPVEPLPRPEPREIDVSARLADSIPAIEIDGTPLTSFAQVIAQLSTLAITIDPEALMMAQVSPSAEIEVKQSDTTVGQILDAALSPHGLTYITAGQTLRIVNASAKPDSLSEVNYRVEDLVSDDESLGELADQVARLIDPQSWTGQGGEGELTAVDGSLVAQQTGPVHFQIVVFLEKLRRSRGMTNRSSYPSQLFDLTPRVMQADEELQSILSMNYLQPELLTRVLERVEAQSELTILIDWQSLSKIGWTPDTTVVLTVDRLPASQVLRDMLTPMELAYRVVDEATLQITSQQDLEKHLEVEFYPIASLLADTPDEDMIISHIRDTLTIDEHLDPLVALEIDSLGGHLLARLPQRYHLFLHELLASWPGK